MAGNEVPGAPVDDGPERSEIVRSSTYQKLAARYRVARLQVKVLEAIAEQSLAPETEADVEGILRGALDELIDIFRAQRGFFLLFGDPNALMARPRLAIGRNFDTKDINLLWQDVSMTVIRAASEGKHLQILGDAVREGPFVGERSVQVLGLRSVLCVPLGGAKGVCPGVVYLEDRSQANRFKRSLLNLFLPFFDLLGRWLERALRPADDPGGVDYAGRWRHLGPEFDGLVGRSRAWAEVLRRLVLVLQDELGPVLIRGPRGSGRELVARTIHKNGFRDADSFHVLRCASIAQTAEGMNVDELRVHCRGIMASASGGTLFLKEIHRLPRAAQHQFLQQIDNYDVRVLASSVEDLRAAAVAGRFLPELARKIGSNDIEVPPLRERGRDIYLLARHFLGEVAAEEQPSRQASITDDALEALAGREWVGRSRSCARPSDRAGPGRSGAPALAPL